MTVQEGGLHAKQLHVVHRLADVMLLPSCALLIFGRHDHHAKLSITVVISNMFHKGSALLDLCGSLKYVFIGYNFSKVSPIVSSTNFKESQVQRTHQSQTKYSYTKFLSTIMNKVLISILCVTITSEWFQIRFIAILILESFFQLMQQLQIICYK